MPRKYLISLKENIASNEEYFICQCQKFVKLTKSVLKCNNSTIFIFGLRVIEVLLIWSSIEILVSTWLLNMVRHGQTHQNIPFPVFSLLRFSSGWLHNSSNAFWTLSLQSLPGLRWNTRKTSHWHLQLHRPFGRMLHRPRLSQWIDQCPKLPLPSLDAALLTWFKQPGGTFTGKLISTSAGHGPSCRPARNWQCTGEGCIGAGGWTISLTWQGPCTGVCQHVGKINSSHMLFRGRDDWWAWDCGLCSGLCSTGERSPTGIAQKVDTYVVKPFYSNHLLWITSESIGELAGGRVASGLSRAKKIKKLLRGGQSLTPMV